MSCKRTCGNHVEGSGYVKPRDPVAAAEMERAYQAALAARSTYDAFWTSQPPYDPNGSNAQHGWPISEPDKKEVGESCNIISYEDMIAAREAYDQKWLEAKPESVDPAEFVGIDDDTTTKIVTIDQPAGLIPVSDFDLMPFDDMADADNYIQHYLPVDPNPPSPLSVAGPGSSSTTTTSDQADKSPVAN